MPTPVKDVNAIAAKWKAKAGAAGPDYEAGVKNPRRDWATNTEAAAGNWQQGTAIAATNGRFAKGVAKAGTPMWQAGAVNKGVVRYPQGVAQAQAKYAANFGPALQVIASVSPPPRQPTGSPNNLLRVSAYSDALHRAKTGV